MKATFIPHTWSGNLYWCSYQVFHGWPGSLHLCFLWLYHTLIGGRMRRLNGRTLPIFVRCGMSSYILCERKTWSAIGSDCCFPLNSFFIWCIIFISLTISFELWSSRDRDLLLVPYSSNKVTVVQWPPFLLASKVYSLHCLLCYVLYRTQVLFFTHFFFFHLIDSYSPRHGKGF